jgi:oligopeptide/dipeptide ABC transporter ATP-binding protein
VVDTDRGTRELLDNVSFTLKSGETLAIVGESGSGKSVTALSIMRLLGRGSRIARGEVLLDGVDLLKLDESQMQAVRGNRISMIFQEPMTALNPVLSIGFQMTEAIRLHLGAGRKEARQMAVDMLRRVGLPHPDQVMKAYPFSLSGGMRQRVMIAMALACKPDVLIADEPTTALDVTVQAQIVRLLKQLCAETGTSIILITHDLGLVAEMADRVLVMYAGQIVEEADVFTLFEQPRHPYTQGLLRSVPTLDGTRKLLSIPGAVPARYDRLPGCRFHNRCPLAQVKCRMAPPPVDLGDGHMTRCWEWKTLNQRAAWEDGCDESRGGASGQPAAARA